MTALKAASGLIARELAASVWPLVVIVILWQLAYLNLPSNNFLRGPADVWSYLRDDERTGELSGAVLGTFGLLALGYAIAIAIAVLVASAIVSHVVLERALMPLVLTLGLLPVIVITPVVIMLVGRSPATTVTVCVLIAFFPCLVNIVSGMRSPSPSMIDLARVLNGGPLRTLISVRLPSAIPGLLSASKLALPAALTGVLLTEFIATGAGAGSFINLARARFQYTEMWAGILAVLVLSILAYTLVSIAEKLLSDRYVTTGSRSAR